jgi:hypothetical protein
VVLSNARFQLNLIRKEGIIRGSLVAHHKPYLLGMSITEVYHTPLVFTTKMYTNMNIFSDSMRTATEFRS